MSMPACECALCMFLCVHTCVYTVYGCVVVSYMSENMRACVCVCVCTLYVCRFTDRGVCKGVSVSDDGEGGLFVI